jgi:hypothetical protein
MRPPQVPDRDSFSGDDLVAYDFVADRQKNLWQGSPLNSDIYFGALMNSPQMARTIAGLGKFMREGGVRGTYSDADRELVDVVLSVDFDYNTILALHLPDMVAVGVRLDAVQALWDRQEERLEDHERLLVEYVRAVVSGSVDDALFGRIVDRMGLPGAVEYSAFITFLISTFRLWQALGVPEPSDAEIDDLLAAYGRGDGPEVAAVDRIG